jgi:hypothetical protein
VPEGSTSQYIKFVVADDYSTWPFVYPYYLLFKLLTGLNVVKLKTTPETVKVTRSYYRVYSVYPRVTGPLEEGMNSIKVIRILLRAGQLDSFSQISPFRITLK